MGYLLVYWRRYRKLFFLGVLFLSIEACCDLLQPTIVSEIIDVGVKSQDLSFVLKMSGLMLLVTCIGAVGAVVRNQVASRVSQRFGADLRLDLFKKINSFTFEQLGQYETTTIITRMTNDSGQLMNFANGLMRIFVKAPILLIGAFIMVSMLNYRLAMILLVVIPIIIALLSASMKFGFPFFASMQKKLDKTNSVIREYLSGVRVVKAFNTFDFETERFRDANESLADTAIKANRVMAVFNPLITFTVNLSIVYLFWNSRAMLSASNLQLGQIVAFINYMGQILQSLNMIFNIYQQLIRAKASSDRIGEVLNNPLKEESGNADASNLRGDIQFQNVSFKYNNAAEPTLTGLNFHIIPKEMVGIIGSTGAGKTTLINLIPGFYNPTEGRVLLDGLEVSAYDSEKLREKISVVTQKTQLFSGTISENISYGKPGATEEEIIRAAKLAFAHDFIISFPNGYQTELGQNGVNLSGGQKQRISLARAFIRNSSILILDDCVSAVDVYTESAILNAIGRIGSGMTCVMITQRISSVINLPKIIALDDGKIVGVGRHEELLKDCEVYAEICRSQIGKGRIA